MTAMMTKTEDKTQIIKDTLTTAVSVGVKSTIGQKSKATEESTAKMIPTSHMIVSLVVNSAVIALIMTPRTRKIVRTKWTQTKI